MNYQSARKIELLSVEQYYAFRNNNIYNKHKVLNNE